MICDSQHITAGIARLKSERGFSLLEVIVVMSIFIVIIIISSEAFNRIVSVSKQQTQLSESDTQGVVGLEMFRRDLEHAGYGLPWMLGFVADFDESQAAFGHFAPGINTEGFNDKYNVSSDSNKVPRAIQASESTTDGRDYLVIKSLMAGMSDTVSKWAYLEGVGAFSKIKTWGTSDFEADERVITIDSRTKRLVGTSMTPADFYYSIVAPNMTPPVTGTADFQPQNDTDVYIVYGVARKSTSATNTDLRVPYNRVDYFVKRPSDPKDIPSRCAPGTGILYKGVMSHAGGGLTQYPLVECMADMQVVFSVAADGVNAVDGDQSVLTSLSAKEIRQQLKSVKIYLVSHEGGRDKNFNYSGGKDLAVGEGNGRTLDLKALVGSDDYLHYRWKTYKLVVTPRNINY